MNKPNKFTIDFWTEKFPGFSPEFKWRKIENNFYSRCHLPYWNVDFGFDPAETHKWLIEHDFLFQNQLYNDHMSLSYKNLGYEWFISESAAGSTLIKVAGTRFLEHEISGEFQLAEDKVEHTIPPLMNFLSSIPLPTIHVSVHRWEPGGFLSPHTDRLKGREHIKGCHVVVPLTKFKGNLKIWPVGKIDTVPGMFHFFNNYDFAHSVWNQTDQVQYAITLSIDHTKLNAEVDNKIKLAARQQWFKE